MDFVQYLLGHGIPDTCVCAGQIALLRDDREVPDTWITTYQFETLGRTLTFEGSMNSIDSQPVTICGRDATLRFNDISHDVTTFEIIPAGHNRNSGLPREYERGKTAAQPNHKADWIQCIRSRGTPKCSTAEAFVEPRAGERFFQGWRHQPPDGKYRLPRHCWRVREDSGH